MKEYRIALVLGLGESGEAAARLLLSEGVRVTVVDSAPSVTVGERAALLEREGATVLTGVKPLPVQAWDVCVTSPGIARESSWIRELEGQGVNVISELELGASRTRCPFMAITGSNGKSTLVKLCGQALAEAGKKVDVVGNYGRPLSDFARESHAYDWGVVEVSSFQLECVKEFRPRAAALINVNPNHLNRHGTLERYTELKSRLFARMESSDTAVTPEHERDRMRALSGGCPTWVTFGSSHQADYQYSSGCIVSSRSGKSVSVVNSVFANDVMGMTAAAAAAMMESCGVGIEAVGRAATAFEPLPHRMNTVAVVNGIRFINDSKATNLAAMQAALEMCGRHIRLIAGGQLKEKDLVGAGRALMGRVKGLYLIGEAAPTMKAAWGDALECRMSGNLATAVQDAWNDSTKGDTVLLSPACASFDQFRSYEDRGEQFVALVQQIQQRSKMS